MGLNQAGFIVRGVDKDPQPDYPFEFAQGDALDVDLSDADFVWASPPCQCFTTYGNRHPNLASKYEDLIEPTRDLLQKWGGPWVMENVERSPLRDPITLCGSMFGLDIRRHRLFESNIKLTAPSCDHSVWKPNRFPGGRSISQGGPRVKVRGTMEIGRWNIPFSDQKEAMGMPWVTDLRKLSEAVPPIYAKFIGTQVREKLEEKKQDGVARWRPEPISTLEDFFI